MERSRAVGMTIISPTLLATRFGVKAPFVAFGLAGFAWLAVWLVAIAANPHSQSRISREELQYIKRGSEDPSTVGMELNSSASSRRSAVPPFRLLLSKLPTWAIIVANFMNNWVHIELYLVLVA
jgi:ACS family sodium-dependent inorganic phosphate cotransporter